jgi:heme-degrading monooxygenase HmoA
MSVLLTLLARGDAAELERRAAARPERMQQIVARAKQHGALSHSFYGSDDGQILVVDEWESEEGFRAFFAASPEIPELMAEIGATEQPKLTFWRRLDTHDEF